MSVQGSGDQTENEANIDLKGVIKDLAEQIKRLTDIVEKSTKKINANTTANADWHKYQALMRIEQEKEHGRQVRLNKEYGRTEASLQMFTGLLTKGASAGFIFNKLGGAIGGVSKELDKFKEEAAELAKLTKQYKDEQRDLSKPENRMQRDLLAAQQARTNEAEGKMDEKKGGSGKLAEGISSMKAFAEKHKTGILIGAGSIGILLTVLKKAFDVSPMFQAIRKLLQFGFMLILRPIGDFFGFIMRPIMVMMLRKFIIPWYKDVYPVMKKLGTWIGNQLVPTMEGILTWLSTPVGTATAVGAGTAAAVGVPVATLLMLKKLTTWLGIGGKGGGAVGSGSGASNAVAGLQKSVSSIRARIVQLFKHPKMVISQITKNIGTKLNSITATVRSAIGGVRTALTTSASKITNFFTKGLNTATKNIGTKLSQMLPKITTSIKNVATTIGAKVGQLLPKITQGFSSLAGSLGNLGKGVGNIFGKMGQTLGNVGKNLKMGNLLGKVGRGGGIAGVGMILEGLFASPETLGDLIPEDSKYRIDKLFNNAFGTGLSEDAEGNFKTIGYGDELMAAMGGDESYKHGIIAKLYGGEATGLGGGAGDVRSERGTNITINVDHINNEMDLKHVGEYVSESLAVENKKTAGT